MQKFSGFNTALAGVASSHPVGGVAFLCMSCCTSPDPIAKGLEEVGRNEALRMNQGVMLPVWEQMETSILHSVYAFSPTWLGRVVLVCFLGAIYNLLIDTLPYLDKLDLFNTSPINWF